MDSLISSSAIFSCNICGKETKNNCSNCKQVYYCCVEHQKQNWKIHKNQCHPFKIIYNKELGRHLVATRNIKPQEIVLKEAPLLRGPSQLTSAICLGCLNCIDPADYINCVKCGWPLCGTECGQKAEHQYECELTVRAGKKIHIEDFSMPQPMYQCITTLRGLMLRHNKPELWSKLNMLESLEDIRRGSMQWKADYESVCKLIVKFFNTQLFEEDDIMRVIGILQINGHEIPTSHPPHVAIYYTASFLEHSCTPNLAKSFNKDGHLILWAPHMIQKGSHLSICYTDAVWATADRQRHLMQTKLFKCNCARCLDVTEYDTKYSALNCERDNCMGLMLPRSLNDWHKEWICEVCNHQVDKVYVNSTLDRASSDFNAMAKTKENCLKYMNHYRKWLPPQHFFINDAKMLLIQKIGYDAKDLMKITQDDLNMKLNYTKELIKLYEILAPCEVRLLGLLYFEMHSSISEHTRRLALKTKLTNSKELLEESLIVFRKAEGKVQRNQSSSQSSKKGDDDESKKNIKKSEKKDGYRDDVPAVPFLHMFKYATKRNRFMYFLGIISVICTGLTVPGNSVLLGNLVNGMVAASANINHEKSDSNKNETVLKAVETFSIQSAILGVIMLACSYISVTLFNYAAQDQILHIRGIFFQSVIHQDVSWFDTNQSGAIASRMNEDLTKMEDGMGEKIVMFMHFMIAFFGSIILAFIKGWQLALVCLSSLPVTFISMGFISLSTSKLAKQESNIYAAAGGIAQEALSAIRTVKAFEGEYKEVNAYKDQIIGARNLNIKRNLFSGLGFGLLWFFTYTSYGLAFWYGTGLVLKNYAGNEYYSNYDAGTMITVFFAVMMGSMNIGLASPYIEAFGVAKGACAKTFKLIEQQPSINSVEKCGRCLTESLNQLVFRNVTFAYPTRSEITVLNKLNIQIDHGQMVALVGYSGCGKSTCIQLIQRFYDPNDGDILFNGVNIKELNVNWLRQRIGVVGQEPVLFGTSIYENIRYGYTDASEKEVAAAARAANALQFIKQLPNGFDTLVGERGAQLSGGQKQRIAIARALIRNPEILLLDEATSALDAESENIVKDALEMASQGRTTIIVAHRLSTVRRANRIIVLDNGQMVESGTHDELMARKQNYYNLVMNQLEMEEKNATAVITSAKLKIKPHQDYSDLSGKNLSWMERNKVISSKQEDEVEPHVLDMKQFSIWPILKLNGNEWPYILCGSLSAIITGTAMPLFALLFGNMMKVFTDHTDFDYIRSNTNTYSLYFVLCGIVIGVGTFLQIYTFGIAGEKLTERVRGLMFESMLQMEVAWFDDCSNGTGTLCSRLSSDAAAIQGATGQRIGTVMQSLSTMCLGIALAMYYEWSLGLLALSFTPFIFIAMYYQRKIMAEENMGTGKIMEKCTTLSVEVVSNIRTVISLGLESMFHTQYMEMLTPAVTKAKRNTHFRALVFGSGRALMFFAYATCMYYGNWLVLKEELTFGDVFKVAQAVIMGATTIANAMAFAPNFQKGLTAAQKIHQLLRREPKIVDHVADTMPSTSWHSSRDVDYNNVKFSYSTRPSNAILKDLDIKIKSGQKVALVGASGCGKSTCIQLIQRFYDVDDGSIAINKNDIRNISTRNLRKQLGIVSQEPILFNRTISDNIAYGDNNRLVPMSEIIEAAKKANIHNFITTLPAGYETCLGEKATQLSGGQKQRIAIARVLIRNPIILLLDEATSALDAENERIVQDALTVASEGRTTITIAHRLTTIIDSDVIYVLNDGQVYESGTHTQLIEERGLYYTLYKLQTSAI